MQSQTLVNIIRIITISFSIYMFFYFIYKIYSIQKEYKKNNKHFPIYTPFLAMLLFHYLMIGYVLDNFLKSINIKSTVYSILYSNFVITICMSIIAAIIYSWYTEYIKFTTNLGVYMYLETEIKFFIILLLNTQYNYKLKVDTGLILLKYIIKKNKSNEKFNQLNIEMINVLKAGIEGIKVDIKSPNQSFNTDFLHFISCSSKFLTLNNEIYLKNIYIHAINLLYYLKFKNKTFIKDILQI